MQRSAKQFLPPPQVARWLAAVAHELRNPLQPLRCFVHLARLRGQADPELLRGLGAADRQLQLLQRLVDDLACLGNAGWTADRLQLRRVPLRAAVEHAIDVARPLLAARGQALFVTLAPQELWLHGDADRLLQIAVNLLANAAKFTPHGGHVHVQLRAEPQAAVLEVRDTGVGLADDELDRIFQPFARGRAATEAPGAGIGLAVVRLFVEQHGGTVTADNACPGARFTVRFPAVD